MLRPAASQWLQLPTFTPLVPYSGLSKPAMTEYCFPDGFMADVRAGGAALSHGGVFASSGCIDIESPVGSMRLNCYLVVGSPARAV